MLETTLYLLRYLLIGLALGTAFAKADSIFTNIREQNRFLMGVSATPLFIALLAYLLGLVWPGAPRLLFILLPVALSGLYLAWKRNYRVLFSVCRGLYARVKAHFCALLQGDGKWWMVLVLCIAAFWFVHVFRAMLPTALFGSSLKKICLAVVVAAGCFLLGRVSSATKKLSMEGIKSFSCTAWRYAVLCLVLAMFISLLGEMYYQGTRDLYGPDEAHYATQARYFAEDRNSWEIDRYTGEKAGTVFPDDHGPLWPAYLAEPRFFPSEDPFNSLPIEVAVLITAPLMLLALGNVGAIVCGSAVGGVFSVALFFLYRYSMRFILQGSRDGFRFIALLLLVVLVYEFSLRLIHNHAKQRGRVFSWRDYVVMLLFSYLCMNGHGGNIYIMLGLVIAFGIIAIASRIRFGELICLGGACLFGTLPCLAKNIAYYFSDGNFRSHSSAAFEGTAVVAQLQQIGQQRNDPATISATYLWSDWLLIGLGLAATVYCIVGFMTMQTAKKQGCTLAADNDRLPTFVLGVLVIGMLLPLTGLFNFIAGDVSVWFIEQLRYRMYFLLLAALMGGVTMGLLLRKKRFAWLVYAAKSAVLIVCLASLYVMNSYYYRPPQSAVNANGRVDFLKNAAEIAQSEATKGDVFAGEQIIAYYFETPPKLLFDEYCRPLLVAKTNEEIEAALHDLRAQVFVFDSHVVHDFSLLPFYEYIQDEENATHYMLGDANFQVDIYAMH